MSDRLQKVIAHAGVASRRKAEKLIAAGHVKVNGQVVKELGTKVSSTDEVKVDEVPIAKEPPVYYLLYKPRGVITAVTDDKHRKTVVDILEEVPERIYPVGRLDYDTSGLLILTNDGDLDNQLTHPKYEVEKTYVAKVKGIVTNDDLKRLRTGVMVDGRKTSKAKTNLIRTNRESSIVSLTIHEGRNHQVKKMFESIAHPVEKLSRETYGFLTLRGLQPGEYRRLKPHEVEELKELSEKVKR
ncbi:MAG: pseudouridine synthase [Lentilactobacillus diolivorans]|jgi:23S rRNA pseudouridine2605 synthase|uniref:Pseudouridine synthase n=2 Tax=Lentilactobacillus diolivorans TaxID=179838 RepID=A0A0R1S5I8_9LACO|nr:pseudouridine synthase [Lentilactobacillus diolivorans]RRG04625.1 MAG: rRNA pseudouridine synthase [Lactobacillus sp.]KRL64240.1 pseudouridine synthase B, ribosomal large subunit [Lentilactobacillus diolivorans DSM 14421]MCH4163240.1 rRNA pseudouridine synthase [Lentilactobacillus diolivorans]MDH5106050.1 rRNA pseudouridine synthase [Lentilactobacillus diolivorans]GEP22692.1 pseudouridine synthase [Lentilactobacillus diolivorans]